MKKVRYVNKNRASRGKENDNFVNRILNSGIGQIVLVGLSILMILSVYRSFRQMAQKISLLKQAEQEVNDLRLENLELSLKIEKAGTTESLEKEARDRLNYGQEDEIAFVIDDDLIDVGKQEVDNILNPEQQTEPIDVLDEWANFIINGY